MWMTGPVDSNEEAIRLGFHSRQHSLQNLLYSLTLYERCTHDDQIVLSLRRTLSIADRWDANSLLSA